MKTKNVYKLKQYTMQDFEDSLYGNNELNLHQCACCEGIFETNDMQHTTDCYGIPFRLVCMNCYEACMKNGYDGQIYNEFDENIFEY